MSIIDDFTGRPQAAPDHEAENVVDNAVERDLLSMPTPPWKAATATLFTVVLAFCIAHAFLLATKEKNKLVTETLALRAAKLTETPGGATISGHEVVLIPAGEFTMGRPEDDATANSDATPEQTVFLPAYYIGKYEVTNTDYMEFVQATRYVPPANWGKEGVRDGVLPKGMGNLPVTHINWEQAKAYAAWRGGRLCSEAEWEKAARGTDRRLYAWGNDYDPARANVDYEVQHLTPVGSYPEGVSPYGVYDLTGNVYEWTADRYTPYLNNHDDLSSYAAFTVDEAGNVVQDKNRQSFYVVVRGGCWKCDPWSSQVTTRNPTRPGYASDFFGARVCWDDPASRGVHERRK
ncbi:MAG: formylglycine-generating enzyme family protein [Nitrospirota bacterium]|nr:formylglycine-generating enzyme family protein [Nitrospirota bacterium]